jgi:hypothetical protein
MMVNRLKHAVIGASMIGACLGVTSAVAQSPADSLAVAQSASRALPVVISAKLGRTARREARVKADVASLFARTAARREPKSALKGIALTSSEKNALGWIAEMYLDRSEDMDRDDKAAYRTSTDTSTLLGDIATMRLEQRAALRAALKPANRLQFDTNVATLVAKERTN